MEGQEIELLLEKYWEATSTLEDEIILREYFNGKNVDPALEVYKSIFQYFVQAQQAGLDDSFDAKVLKSILNEKETLAKVRPLWSVHLWKYAASGLILTLGWWGYHNYQEKIALEAILKKDTFEDPQKAYKEAKEALMLVSSKLNKGESTAKSKMSKVKKATRFFKKGTDI